MGMTFDQLTPASGLQDEDIFAFFQNASGTNLSISASLFNDYINSTSCGHCRGNWPSDKALTAADGPDIGVWKWIGEATTEFPYTYAIVEIIRHEKRAGTDGAWDLVQRLNVGDAVYQRFKSGTTSAQWSPLKRFDTDYEIKYGSGTTDQTGECLITFSTPLFVTTPKIFISPIYDASDYVVTAQLGIHDSSQFKVRIFSQHLPTELTVPVIELTTDGTNYGLDHAQDLANFITEYCMPKPVELAFEWVAIAPKTVTPS